MQILFLNSSVSLFRFSTINTHLKQKTSIMNAEKGYLVSKLLRTPSSNNDDGKNHMRTIIGEVEAFLHSAPHAPPIVMEAEEENCLAVSANSEVEVELRVVAGFLEPKDDSLDGESAGKRILIPTEKVQEELTKAKSDEARALVRLWSALTPQLEQAVLSPASRSPQEDYDLTKKLFMDKQCVSLSDALCQANTQPKDNSDFDSDNESKVSIMYADDTNSSDGDSNAGLDRLQMPKRRFILEVSTP